MNINSELDEAEKFLNRGESDRALVRVADVMGYMVEHDIQYDSWDQRAESMERRALDKLGNRDIYTRVIKPTSMRELREWAAGDSSSNQNDG